MNWKETLSIDTGPWTQYLLLFGFSRGTLYNMGNLGPEINAKGKQEWIKEIVQLTNLTLTPFMCIFFGSNSKYDNVGLQKITSTTRKFANRFLTHCCCVCLYKSYIYEEKAFQLIYSLFGEIESLYSYSALTTNFILFSGFDTEKQFERCLYL